MRNALNVLKRKAASLDSQPALHRYSIAVGKAPFWLLPGNEGFAFIALFRVTKTNIGTIKGLTPPGRVAFASEAAGSKSPSGCV